MIDPISRHLQKRSAPHGPLILMYHAVTAGRSTPPWPWAVSMARFTEQLDLLVAEGWNTVTVKELTANQHELPPRTLAITFDDGYQNNGT